VLQNELEIRLNQFYDPYLEREWGVAKIQKQIIIEKDTINIKATLGYPHRSVYTEIQSAITEWIAPISQNKRIQVNLQTHIDAHVAKQGIVGLANVKNMIAVASGKGGVGKSTIAVNLALALAHEGAQVGLLDADIYGPSQPAMLGSINERPLIKERTIQPIMRHGIQTISIGNLVDAQAAMVWRGPMLGKALEQLMYDTQWTGLDYLVIDLPPGTGDIQLSLCQKMPLSGALMVTTPQDLALLDVRRACEMFNKLQIPVLGIVENMSVYHCSECGHAQRIFGEGGGVKLASEYQLPLLAAVPLDMHIRTVTDHGQPLTIHDPEHPTSKVFFEMAIKVAAKLALQPKDYSAKFPKVVVR
jgi:ATP-binding protein involved in chromosome partitioning